MTATGLVKLSLPAGVVHNASGVGNSASTGANNFVFYDIDPATEALRNPAAGSTILDSTLNTRVTSMSSTRPRRVSASIRARSPTPERSSRSAAPARRASWSTARRRRMGGDVFRYTYTGKFSAGLVSRQLPRRLLPGQRGQLQQGRVVLVHRRPAAISINSVSVNKPTSGTAKAPSRVSLSSPVTSTTVTVKYSTRNGTNTVAGRDYIVTSGTLTFKAGMATSQTITVPVIGNSTPVTTTETFYLDLLRRSAPRW